MDNSAKPVLKEELGTMYPEDISRVRGFNEGLTAMEQYHNSIIEKLSDEKILKKSVRETWDRFFDCLAIDYRNHHNLENAFNQATMYLATSLAQWIRERGKDEERR